MSGEKILIVDDEEDLLYFVARRLRRLGFAVMTAGDGEEGLDKIQENQPDLVLLDIKMPKVNGYELCRALKRRPETKKIPVIFVTAQSRLEDRLFAAAAGGDDFLLKPFEFEVLVGKIKKLLDKRPEAAHGENITHPLP